MQGEQRRGRWTVWSLAIDGCWGSSRPDLPPAVLLWGLVPFGAPWGWGFSVLQ
eukprot:COSAG02_NODE_9674_length_2146_cov_3.259893_2_plen_53_part_00